MKENLYFDPAVILINALQPKWFIRCLYIYILPIYFEIEFFFLSIFFSFARSALEWHVDDDKNNDKR